MGLRSDIKDFSNGLEETANSMHDNRFVLKIETRIRQKGREFMDYTFLRAYNFFVFMSFFSLFFGYLIVRYCFPETDIAQLQYTMFHDLDNIRFGVLGSAIKATFYAFLFTCSTFTLFGLCMAIKHGSIRLFFDFLGQSFYQGYKASIVLGILFFLFIFT